jgi:transcriptional regulator with XRE-family HTH domain
MEASENPEFHIVFGQQVRLTRRGKKWGLKNLAPLAGMAETELAKIERGEIKASMNRMERIVLALGFTLAEFFDKEVFKARKL